MDNIVKREADLWTAADTLRSNGNVPSNEYFMPVLGLNFLRHATSRYLLALTEIEAAQAAGKMPKRPMVKGDFIKRRALQSRHPRRNRGRRRVPHPTASNFRILF